MFLRLTSITNCLKYLGTYIFLINPKTYTRTKMYKSKNAAILQIYLICLITTANCIYHINQKDLYLLQTFEGEVGAENFTYYTVSSEGNILIRLHSLSGDADLYVSCDSKRPNWQEYSMKSTTCGVDSVIIDYNIVRPVEVGVYGHVEYQKSEFLLEEFVDTSYVSENGDFSSDSNFELENETKMYELLFELLKFVLNILFEILT